MLNQSAITSLIKTIKPLPRIFFTEPERHVFRARERIKPSVWAEKYRVITNGPYPGPWLNSRTPYLVEPMDTFALPWVRKIFLSFSPQSAKTQFAFNCLCWAADVDPGPAMYVMPDEKVARRISRRQIIPMLKASPRISALLSSNVKDMNALHIQFRHGMDLMLVWATSAAAMASESVRYMFYDEPAKYPLYSGREADVFSLGDVRTNVYSHNSKQVFFTSPNLEDDPSDRLLREEFDETRVYKAVCPICRHPQQMRFRNIHWGNTQDGRLVMRKKLARYSCEDCKMDWDDHLRDRAISAGHWEAINPVERPSAVAFAPFPSWQSPFVSMSASASAYLKGLHNPKRMMAFITQHKCQAYAEKLPTRDETSILKLKTKLPAGIVPVEAVALTAGIDVQKVGFWFVVRAWTATLKNWLVQYGYLSTWLDVETLLFSTRYAIEKSDLTMGIWRAGMDTGGGATDDDEWTRTEEIYQWLRANGRGIVYGIKGASRTQLNRVKPTIIDKLPRKNIPIPGGLELRIIDTVQFKDLIQWRMENAAMQLRMDADPEGETELHPGPQQFYLNSDTGQDYARQLTAEVKKKHRNGKVEWIQIRKDNHLLDCEVMAAACADSEWTPALAFLAARQAKAPAEERKQPQDTQGDFGGGRPKPRWFKNR